MTNPLGELRARLGRVAGVVIRVSGNCHLSMLCLLATVASTMAGCGDKAAERTVEQAVVQSGQASERAAKQLVEAEAQVRHERRLRDIEKSQAETSVDEAQTQVTVVRGYAVALAIALVVTLLWLAAEVRRRRVLAALVNDLLNKQQDAAGQH